MVGSTGKDVWGTLESGGVSMFMLVRRRSSLVIYAQIATRLHVCEYCRLTTRVHVCTN